MSLPENTQHRHFISDHHCTKCPETRVAHLAKAVQIHTWAHCILILRERYAFVEVRPIIYWTGFVYFFLFREEK
jgi:hypothetical protein